MYPINLRSEHSFLDVFTAGARLHGQLRRVLSNCARLVDLNESECRALWICLNGPDRGVTQTVLAHELGRSMTHVSLIMDSLRKRGMVKSERRMPDRRQKFWTLTQDGRQFIGPVSVKLDDSLLGTASSQLAAAAFADAAENLCVEFYRQINPDIEDGWEEMSEDNELGIPDCE